MQPLKKIFIKSASFIVDIALYIVVFYANVFFLYLAKRYDSILFDIELMIFVMVIAYLIMLSVRKIFGFRNIMLISIYPVDVNAALKMIYRQRLYDVFVIYIMFCIPNIIFHNVNVASCLILWLACIVDLNIGILFYSFAKRIRIKDSSLKLYELLYFVISAEVLLYLIQWLGRCRGKQNLVLLMSGIVFLCTIQMLRMNLNKIVKAVYSVGAHHKDERRFANTVVAISSRVLKNHFWCRRELKNIIVSVELKGLLVRTIVIVGFVAFYIISNNCDIILMLDFTTVIYAANYFAPLAYYREQYIYETSQIMPISAKLLMISKTIVNGTIWFVLTIPVAIMNIIQMDGLLLWYIVFCVSSSFIWSYIGVCIDKKNNYECENTKNKYSRVIVAIIAVAYIYVQKEIVNKAGIEINHVPMFYCLMNAMLIIMIIRRMQNAKFNECE